MAHRNLPKTESCIREAMSLLGSSSYVAYIEGEKKHIKSSLINENRETETKNKNSMFNNTTGYCFTHTSCFPVVFLAYLRSNIPVTN